MSCVHLSNSACPFAWWTDESDQAQNYGCLPTPHDIVVMRVHHNKTWACHDNPTTPCVGAINHLKKNNLPYSVCELVTEKDNWDEYTTIPTVHR